jgi:predicted RNase H-like nuclease (RuvC/YqgF family)
MRQAEARTAELEREWRTQGSRLQELMRYNRQMENILNEKNDTIARLEAEAETAKHSLPPYHHDLPEHHLASYFTAVN